MNLYVNTLWYLQAVLDNSIMEIYALHKAELRSMMPTSGISKPFYKFLWLQMTLDNSNMKSYNSNLQ